MRCAALLIACLLGVTPTFAQAKWYRFNKTFIQQHYQADGSAVGPLHVGAMHPAKSPHPISCGGDDGELHIGVSQNDLGSPVSGFASSPGEVFGMVAEPPNVSRSSTLFKDVEADDSDPADFIGYFRVWDEGHDVGKVYPSNPHHVLEVHPVWAMRSKDFNFTLRPAVVLAMNGFSGYGASKFVPLLDSASNWLKVAEDDKVVYVQMAKADNFYQLPVVVKQVRTFGGGVETGALVDVFSDTGHQRLVYKGLTVVTATGSRIASQLQTGWVTYLLGFFSVNLAKAMTIAAGHEGPAESVAGTGALEFFAFGVPKQHAVSKSTPCTEEDD